jgi:hypothetical protein
MNFLTLRAIKPIISRLHIPVIDNMLIKLSPTIKCQAPEFDLA